MAKGEKLIIACPHCGTLLVTMGEIKPGAKWPIPDHHCIKPGMKESWDDAIIGVVAILLVFGAIVVMLWP